MNNQAGGSAYPHENHLSHRGMSLRDYFAAKAMQGMFASGLLPQNVTNEELSIEAYKVADTMLKARNG